MTPKNRFRTLFVWLTYRDPEQAPVPQPPPSKFFHSLRAAIAHVDAASDTPQPHWYGMVLDMRFRRGPTGLPTRVYDNRDKMVERLLEWDKATAAEKPVGGVPTRRLSRTLKTSWSKQVSTAIRTGHFSYYRELEKEALEIARRRMMSTPNLDEYFKR
jgi:hypothetical protein